MEAGVRIILVGGAPIAIEIARADHHTIDWILGLTTGGTIALWCVLAGLEVALGRRGRTMRWFHVARSWAPALARGAAEPVALSISRILD